MNSKSKSSDVDMVVPNNNEEQFIRVAKSLGYTELIFLTDNINYRNPIQTSESLGITIKKAYLLKNTSEIPRARKIFDILVGTPERGFFESKIDFIIDAETHPSKDSFHYRKTSLNQVHAKLCRDKGSKILFGFSGLLYSKNISTLNILIGRMMQNARIIRKYSVDGLVFSLADNPSLMRDRHILSAFSRVIGNDG